jgi:hypothetical protein
MIHDANPLDRMRDLLAPHLELVYAARKYAKPSNSPFLIASMANDGAYVQALASRGSNELWLEAASSQSAPELETRLEASARAVLKELGFNEPGSKRPNFWRYHDARNKDARRRAAAVLARALVDVFGFDEPSQIRIATSLPAGAENTDRRAKGPAKLPPR